MIYEPRFLSLSSEREKGTNGGELQDGITRASSAIPREGERAGIAIQDLRRSDEGTTGREGKRAARGMDSGEPVESARVLPRALDEAVPAEGA